MTRRMILMVIGIAATWSWISPAAEAQSTADVERALATLSHEPTVAETTRVSLRYFRVDPQNFDRLRSAARRRSILPLIATGYRYDDDRTARIETQRLTNPTDFTENVNVVGHGATVGAIWDLRQAIFNPSEVQVYGLIGVQRDLMLEVTRTYYLRRQLQLRMFLRPPEDALAQAALQLRIDEFTAILDVLSDGWFSTESERRGRSRTSDGP